MKKKKRHVGQVHFNLLNSFESNLLEYALDESNGPSFSSYIKRLIHQDKNKMSSQQSVIIPPVKIQEDNKDAEAASAFL